MIKLKIAGLIIQLNMPIKLLHDNMYDFLYKGADDADIIWSIIFDNNYQIDEKPYISAKTLDIYYKNKNGDILKTKLLFVKQNKKKQWKKFHFIHVCFPL